MVQETEFGEMVDGVKGVPVSALLSAGRKNKYGSVPGLEDEELASAQELCRKLKAVLGKKVDRLWSAYMVESDVGGKADIEQVLDLLAAKHLGQDYQPDRSPFPPPANYPPGNQWLLIASKGAEKLA